MKKTNLFLLTVFFIPILISLDNNDLLTGFGNDFLKLGVDNIPPVLLGQLRNKKWAIICNNSSITDSGKRSLDYLRSKKIGIKKIIAPEHGSSGRYQAEHHVPDGTDPKTKLPIFSAHKNGPDGRKIKSELLEDVDGIIFDIQDTGMRHYTYVSTLCEAIDACNSNNKILVVLDRPNPLGGLIDGPLVCSGYESFISRINVPLRHGLTLGECAKYYNYYQHKNKTKIKVVPLQNYRRNCLNYKVKGALSPNIPDVRSCQGYSVCGLLGELSPIHVGVGTENPFSVISLPEDSMPKYVWYQLKRDLGKYGLDCKTENIKKNNKDYYGLNCKFNPNLCPTVPVLAEIVETLKDYNVKFKTGPSLAKAFGNNMLHEYIDSKITKEMFINHYKKELKDFYKNLIKSKAVLYSPAPYIYDC